MKIKNWKEVTIGDVATIIGGGTPSTLNPSYWNGDIQWFTPAELNDSKKYVSKSERTITEQGLKESSAKLLPKGTVLLTTRASIGLTAILKNPACTNQGFQSLIAKDICCNEFLYYDIPLIKDEMLSRASGSTFAEISAKKLSTITLQLPPLAEQQRIAKALSDVDALISTTEKLIQKKKNIKQGTMQNLLTGKKRLPGFGPQTKSPAYKQTELGPIPEDWEVKSLCSYASLITKGTTPTSIGDNFTDSGIKFIKIESLTSDYKIDLSRIAYISESTHKRLYRSELKRNDLLISIAGALGKTAIVESNVLPANTNQALAIVRLSDNNLLNVHFLLYWINSKIIQEMIKDMSVTGAQPNISLKNVNDLPIIIPSKEEQTAIVNILSSMDKEIETLNTKLEKYRNLKTAMMQQLLTGKIRLT